MSLLGNLKIGARLALAFGFVLLLLGAIVALGTTRMAGMNQDTQSIVNDRIPKITDSYELRINSNRSMRAAYRALLEKDPVKLPPEVDLIHTIRDENSALMTKVEKSINSEAGRKAFAEVSSERAKFHAAQDEMMQFIESGQKEQGARVMLNQVEPAMTGLIDALGKFSDVQAKLVREAGEGALASYHGALALMLSLSGAAFLLAGLMGWFVTRSITGPVSGAVRAAESVAAGDLTTRIEGGGRDEVGQLLVALRSMTDCLGRVVGEVRSGVESVATASGQIAAGNQDLSSRTEEQASSLEETAASMEELTSTVTQAAESARQASQLAVEVSASAARGGEVVGSVVGTMDEIASSSRRMAEIINVIDGIAFQTNILALNAAVEAARAGEQGRGFAVVAGEVRNLAQRSAQAAREIKDMIQDSAQKVDAGSRLVGEAGTSMQEIVSQVKRITDLIGEITSSSMEQSSGIQQINSAVTQMDQVTQQNAALVEQSAAAAQSLKSQADKLAEVVAVFRVGHEGAQRAAPASHAAPARHPAPAKRPAVHRPSSSGGSHKPAPALATAGAGDGWDEF